MPILHYSRWLEFSTLANPTAFPTILHTGHYPLVRVAVGAGVPLLFAVSSLCIPPHALYLCDTLIRILVLRAGGSGANARHGERVRDEDPEQVEDAQARRGASLSLPYARFRRVRVTAPPSTFHCGTLPMTLERTVNTRRVFSG